MPDPRPHRERTQPEQVSILEHEMNRARRRQPVSVREILEVSILEHEMNRARQIDSRLDAQQSRVSILEHEMNRARRAPLVLFQAGSNGFNPRARNESCPTGLPIMDFEVAPSFNPRARNESCPTR